MLFSYKVEDISRFSNLHQCTFKSVSRNMLTETRNVTFFVSSFLNFIQLRVLHFLCRQYKALNERSYWLIEMNNRKTLQASAFSFIVLNLAEKAVLHFFIVMLNYIMSALRKKQLQLPTQSTFIETLKTSVFSFIMVKHQSVKVTYRILLLQVCKQRVEGEISSALFFRKSAQIVAIY